MSEQALKIATDSATGAVSSVQLYGEELLDSRKPCISELFVNGHPLAMRPHRDPNTLDRALTHLKGEHFVNQFSGWGLVLARVMGARANLKHPCFGIQTLIRRELADQSCPCPGPGGPVVEAPLYVDTFSVLNWNWKFWGDETRMIFCSSHSNGPADEFGHVGYEHDKPEQCKRFMQNIWRRIYPGCMVIHGGLFYNTSTGHWLAITCRKPQVGYALNIQDAGRGVAYDFTLHAYFNLGDSLQIPEIKLYYGADRKSMMSWLADYTTFYYEEPPEWVFKTVFSAGLGWNNQPDWTAQADYWKEVRAKGTFSGINYCLVTNRPIHSGTTPTGYEPDPNHGSTKEFRSMCRAIAADGTPILIWMSHSGMLYQGGSEIDDDWFIRGIDGRVCASWGSIDGGGITHINPGHPGYIEYTKKWIRFYIKECRCKGIFFDCLSWALPPDFRPRSFMRYPGDTNLMAIRFMEETYACIKECDPDAIMLGEGSSLDGPVNVLSIHANPKRAIDGMGPRDFLLQLSQYGAKRLVIDQGPALAPASGYCIHNGAHEHESMSRYLTKLLQERGGRDAFIHLPGDLSIIDDLLIVPWPYEGARERDILLPDPWKKVDMLMNELDGVSFKCGTGGVFANVSPGIFRMQYRR